MNQQALTIPIPDDLAGELLALENAPELPLIRLDPSTLAAHPEGGRGGGR